MSDKTPTAVGWLVQQLSSSRYFYSIMLEIESRSTIVQPNSILHQAIEMEKQQAFEFWQGGIACTEEGGKSFDQFYADKYNDK